MSYDYAEKKWGAGFPHGAARRLHRLIVLGMLFGLISASMTGSTVNLAFGDSMSSTDTGTGKSVSSVNVPIHIPMEERLARIERTLVLIEETVKKAEDRSFYNKMASREIVGYVKLTVVVLAIIAAIFPLTIWFLSRRRILGLSGLSSEMAATLLLVEERQAKLAALLKEMQSEIDYLHSVPSPDLKNLVHQAEGLVRKNEADLKKIRDSHKETGK